MSLHSPPVLSIYGIKHYGGGSGEDEFPVCVATFEQLPLHLPTPAWHPVMLLAPLAQRESSTRRACLFHYKDALGLLSLIYINYHHVGSYEVNVAGWILFSWGYSQCSHVA